MKLEMGLCRVITMATNYAEGRGCTVLKVYESVDVTSYLKLGDLFPVHERDGPHNRVLQVDSRGVQVLEEFLL